MIDREPGTRTARVTGPDLPMPYRALTGRVHREGVLPVRADGRRMFGFTTGIPRLGACDHAGLLDPLVRTLTAAGAERLVPG